jgi:hypothetical protein
MADPARERDLACRAAVLTAYRELTVRQCSDHCALQSCARLYRCHFRDASEVTAWSRVRGWVDDLMAKGAAEPSKA